MSESKLYHNALKIEEEKNRLANPPKERSQVEQESRSAAPSSGGLTWTSWAVEGISKTIEKATLDAVNSAAPPQSHMNRTKSNNTLSESPVKPPRVTTHIASTPDIKVQKMSATGWEDELDLSDMEEEKDPPKSVPKPLNPTNDASKTIDDRNSPVAKKITKKPAKVAVKKLTMDTDGDSWDDF